MSCSCFCAESSLAQKLLPYRYFVCKALQEEGNRAAVTGALARKVVPPSADCVRTSPVTTGEEDKTFLPCVAGEGYRAAVEGAVA